MSGIIREEKKDLDRKENLNNLRLIRMKIKAYDWSKHPALAGSIEKNTKIGWRGEFTEGGVKGDFFAGEIDLDTGELCGRGIQITSKMIGTGEAFLCEG